MVDVSDKPLTDAKHEDIIGSIAHAREVLLCLSRGINSLSDIARECGFSKSTVHRLLKSMEKYNLAIENCLNRQYYLGPLIKKLAANPMVPHRQLINCAADEMRRLANTTEETVALDIMSNIQYVPLYEITSRHDLKVTQENKKIGPSFSGIYAGATVKALLSQLNDEKLNIVLDNININPETERTITDKEILIAQLKEIRHTGYAVSRGERIMGTLCAAAPVKGYYLPVVLSIAGPEARLQPYIKKVLTELTESASKISVHLISVLKKRGNNNNGRVN